MTKKGIVSLNAPSDTSAGQTADKAELFELVRIAFIAFSSYVGFAFLNPVFGLVFRSLGLADTMAGAVASVGALALIVGSVHGQAGKGQVALRRALLTALFGNVLGHLIFALTTSGAILGLLVAEVTLLLLLVGRITATFFFVLIQIKLLTAVNAQVSDQNSNRGYAALTAANALGLVLGPIAGGALGSLSLFVPVWCVMVFPILGMLACLSMKGPKGNTTEDTQHEPDDLPINRRLVLPLSVALITMFVLSSLQLVVPLFVADLPAFGAKDASRIAGIALFWGGAGVIGANLVLMKVKIAKPEGLIVAGSLIAMPGFLVLGQADSLTALSASLLGVGVGVGLIMPAYTNLATQMAGPRQKTAVSGKVVLFQSLGMAIGPFAGVLLYSYGDLFLGLAIFLGGMAAVTALLLNASPGFKPGS